MGGDEARHVPPPVPPHDATWKPAAAWGVTWLCTRPGWIAAAGMVGFELQLPRSQPRRKAQRRPRRQPRMPAAAARERVPVVAAWSASPGRSGPAEARWCYECPWRTCGGSWAAASRDAARRRRLFVKRWRDVTGQRNGERMARVRCGKLAGRRRRLLGPLDSAGMSE